MRMKRYEMVLLAVIVILIGVAVCFGGDDLYRLPKPATAAPAPAPKLDLGPGAAGGSVLPKSAELNRRSGAVIPSNSTELVANKLGLTLRFHHAVTGCPACPVPHAWVEKYRKSLACPVEIVPHADLGAAGQAGLPFVPCFELVNGRGETVDIRGFSAEGKHKGDSICPGCINKWIQDTREALVDFSGPKPLVAGKSKVASLPYKAPVGAAFDLWAQHIGRGVSVKVRVLRPTGQIEFPLWNNGDADWSDIALLGPAGGRLIVESSRIPFGKYGCDFGVDERGTWARPDAVFISRDGKIAPKAGAGEPCGFIDPISAISLISTVLKVLSIHADLILPQEIQVSAVMNGDTLTVDVQKGPTVAIEHWWTSRAVLKRVTITRGSVLAEFDGTRLLRKREFSLN